MSLSQLCNANMSRNRADATGSSGVGYTVLDTAGSVVTPRTTAGVYQLTAGSGLYAAYVSFPDSFHGQIMWDTGTAFPTASYAVEDFNYEARNPKIDGLYDVAFGRWRIDKVTNTMTFYREDNLSVVATFSLFDDSGNPTFDGVFERKLVGSVTP